MLSQEQVDVFRTQGFLLINGVLDDEDLEPVRTEYAALIDEMYAEDDG